MNPEQQRIELAKLDGWWINKALSIWQHKTREGAPPDYLNDLNDVHELEKKLDWKDQDAYAQELIWITLDVKNDGTPATLCGCFIFTHATAAQRSEAILRAKGIWK